MTADQSQKQTATLVDLGAIFAYVPDHFARPFLASRQLRTVLEDWCRPTPRLALYYPRSRHVPSPL